MNGHGGEIRWRPEDYAATRPDYPDELFESLGPLCAGHELAWDCATGNGQAAIPLARTFRSVVATDADAGQISHAEGHPHVRYVIARAERSPLPDATVDLITVAQALHWFDLPGFYAEVGRTLKPGGLLAVWCYFLPSVNPTIDAAVLRLYSDVLGDYWTRKAKLVEDRYETIPFPFEEVARRTLPMTGLWDLPRLVGYLGTWAATEEYRMRVGWEPVEEIRGELESGWGQPHELREVRWTITLRVGSKDSGRPVGKG